MERMEVDQCAGAGGALRRSNSAPMITNVSDGTTVFSSNSSARYRRSSVSVNPSCPSRTLPLSPFSMSCERSEHKRQIENMELTLRGSLQRLSASPAVPFPPASHWHGQLSPGFHSQDSGVTPNSSPSPTRRFRGWSGIRRSAQKALCRWSHRPCSHNQLHSQCFPVSGLFLWDCSCRFKHPGHPVSLPSTPLHRSPPQHLNPSMHHIITL